MNGNVLSLVSTIPKRNIQADETVILKPSKFSSEEPDLEYTKVTVFMTAEVIKPNKLYSPRILWVVH